MMPHIQEREEHPTKEEFKAVYESFELGSLFENYTSKIDNHTFRGEYARELYEELAEGRGPEIPGYDADNYWKDGKDRDDGTSSGFDKHIARQVSIALGHNRINVAICHYLRDGGETTEVVKKRL